jgi:hypothetical protein
MIAEVDDVPTICGHRWTGHPGSDMPGADRHHWCTHLNDHVQQGRPHECCCGAIDPQGGAPATDGSIATYERCKDPDCPHHKDGYEHAHLVYVDYPSRGTDQQPPTSGE